MSASKLRYFYFLGWMITLVLILLAYVATYVREPVAPSLKTISLSIGILMGIVTPPLTMVLDAFLDEKPFELMHVEQGLGFILTAMCVIYWMTFVILAWAGVFFRVFLSDEAGAGLDNANTAISAVLGAMSFLSLKPASKLFRKKSQ